MTRAIAEYPAELAIGTAARLSRRHGAELVVARVGSRWGGATPATLEHALRLGLETVSLRSVLTLGPLVAPDTPETVVRRALGPCTPFLLVGGTVSRIGAVFADTFPRPGLPASVAARLEKLPEPVLRILQRAGELADDRGWPLALGGGLVRDLFLIDAPPAKADVDLVVEGDARELARRLAQDLVGGVRARPREHPTFLTATVDLPGGARVDVITARRERYRVPGALPEVEPASIERDLWRRDFSLNALAVRLSRGVWGEVLDPTRGLDDLRQRRIRVLHPLSFIEDPTRLFRAVRFAARLEGRLEPTTRHLFTEAVGLSVYDVLSGDRLRAELKLARREARPSVVLTRLGRAGVFRLLLSGYRFGAQVGDLLEQVARAEPALPLTGETREGLYALALTAHLGSGAAAAWVARLGLPLPARRAIERARRDADEILTRLDHVESPATAYRVLTRVSELSAAWARARARRRRTRAYIDAYFREWKAMRPLLTGEDLRAIGIAPGPPMGRLLEELRVAQVGGEVRDRREAIVWAREAVGPRGLASRGFPRRRIRLQSRGG